MWGDFKEAYTNKYLVKWSVWWAFATCGNFQVGNYIQPLWESVAPVGGEDHLYNGAVEAAQTLLSESCCSAVLFFFFFFYTLEETTQKQQ